MTREEKTRIARQLERLRVDVIEAGFPASSNGDFAAVHDIAKAIMAVLHGCEHADAYAAMVSIIAATINHAAADRAEAMQAADGAGGDDAMTIETLGRQREITCDGCPANLQATISYVSPRPEFTPPVIYSRETRDRLVFMVEARPENGASLVPGLPVDVEPLP